MKWLLIFFLIVGSNAFGQDTICDDPDDRAEFPGGSKALKKFIDDNLIYPQESIDNGYSGLCYVKFLICEDGTCQNFKITHGVSDCPNCDKEAIRVLKLMPKWKPALRKGKAVPVNSSVQVVFNPY